MHTILPFINGEPLCDKRMVDFVEKLAQDYPNTNIGWYTNGNLLTEEIATRLLKAGNIKHFNVSMQGGDKETYEHNTGLSWDTTYGNVENLIRINRQLGGKAEIRLNMCKFSGTHKSVPAFRKLWEGRATVCIGCFSNFGGLLHDEIGEAPFLAWPRLVCDRALGHMYVLWDGTVNQCCFDIDGKETYGNVKDSSLEDIWFSGKMAASREAHRNLVVNALPTVCQNCNSNKFHG